MSVLWWSGQATRFWTKEHYVTDEVHISELARMAEGLVNPTAVMQSSLSMKAQMHHYRLNTHFPRRIREVTMEMNQELHEPIVVVHFHNGHTVKRLERETLTDEFLALCGMLYDLPPKGS